MLGCLAGSFLTVATAFASLDCPGFCHEHAERAAERRHLNKAERREVERSCSVSRVTELESHAEARALADQLNQGNRCAYPGAYVSRGSDDDEWLVFCPQL